MIRILAVDDEKPIVELLKLTLNRSGYQCIGAYDRGFCKDIYVSGIPRDYEFGL